MLERFFRNIVFKNFFKINLNAVEFSAAEESLASKYVRGLRESLMYGLLVIPTLLFVDTSILNSVLIPITMVSGTAWFAVSLVNIKKKFEPFGNELTIDLYRAFITSLIFLALMTLVSLNSRILFGITLWGNQYPILSVTAGLLGAMLVLKMIYDVFLGATKYDMNDSMLTGQSEVAEKYFKKSLSLLNSCAAHLRTGISADTTGYYSGLAFYEVFNYVLVSKGDNEEVRKIITETELLKSQPPKTKKGIASKCISLIEQFLTHITNLADNRTRKSYKNIQLELASIRENQNESQAVFNLRLATILEEMEDMLAGQGEMLFKKRLEIERRFLVKSTPGLSSYNRVEILQGYLSTQKTNEQRVRKMGSKYLKTSKRILPSGYREETEEYIPKDEFDKLWPQTEGKRIEKARYQIPYRDRVIELDVFSGPNNGLVIAEVEFDSEEMAHAFVTPDWFGEEVTKSQQYKNANLAR